MHVAQTGSEAERNSGPQARGESVVSRHQSPETQLFSDHFPSPFSRRKPGVIHRHRRSTTPPFYFPSADGSGILRHVNRESQSAQPSGAKQKPQTQIPMTTRTIPKV